MADLSDADVGIAPAVDPARVAGQGGIGINDALYQGAMALPDAGAWLMRKAGLVNPSTPPPSEAFRDFARSQGNTRPPEWEPQNKTEQVARDTGTGVGNALSSIVPFSLAGKLQAIPQVIRGASAALAAKPALQTGIAATGAAAGSATDNPYVGMATDFALPILAHTAQRAVSAAPAANTQEAARRDLFKFGQDNNLGPLTTGKATGSTKLQTLESAASHSPIPFVGGRVAATESAGRDAWQKAIIAKTGEDATAWTKDVSDAAKARLNKQFETLTKDNTINVTPKFGQDLAKIKSEYGERLFEDIQPGVMKRIEELAQAPAALNQPGVHSINIKGTVYQNIRSDLSRISGTATKGADRDAAGKLVAALDDMAEQSLPKDVVGDFKAARQQWRNKVALDNSVFSSNNAETAQGNIPTARFGRESQGNPDLEKLGRYGNMFVGDKAANTSRTAGHNVGNRMVEKGLGLYGAFEGLQHLGVSPLHAGAAIGSLAVPPTLEAAMNNPATRALLMRRYLNPSQSVIPPGVYGSLAGQAALGQQSQ